MQSLYEISNDMRELYNKLENGEGIDLETGEIDVATSTALAMTKSNLQKKSIDIGYVIKSFEDEEEIFDKEIKRLTERKNQIKNIKERLKTNLKNAMEEFGIFEIKGQTLKINFRKSESVEIDDMELLDEKYKTIKTEIKADKTAIKEAIKNGEIVEGARLVTNKNLQIR